MKGAKIVPTPELTAAIGRALEAGATLQTAAELNHLSRATAYRWLQRGRRTRRGRYREFAKIVDLARARAEVRAVARITASRDWRAAMAWLERRNPKDWGRKARVVIGGEAKQPVVTVTLTPEAADEEMLRRLAQMRRNLLASGRVVLRLVP